MNDTISRAAAKQAVHDTIVSASTVARVWDMIDQIPAVDAVPVVHGRWIDERGNAVGWDDINDCCPKRSCWCSVCGDWLTGSDQYATTGNYCPNCGARMDGERKEDE